jgi:hypothetical protein
MFLVVHEGKAIGLFDTELEAKTWADMRYPIGSWHTVLESAWADV